MKLIRAFLFCIALALSGVAYGETITFDDLTGGVYGSNPPDVPNGYQGLNWHELFVVNTATLPASGYVNGTISAKNVMFIPDFQPFPPVPTPTPPATISSSTPFFLVSGYFTAAWFNGVTLEVVGKNGTSTQFDETFIVNTTNASFLTFRGLALTELDFTSSGGDARNSPFLGGSGEQVAVDNLTIDFVNVPEAASTALLLAASAGGLALVRKRFS